MKATDSKKRRTLSKARGIGAEMSCRRRDGAGQSGSFALVKAREAANCSGKPGARRLRRARARKKETFSSSDLSIKFKLALHLFLIYNANMNMVDLIRKKRDCQTLSAAELRFIVDGYVSGAISDEQAAAFCMAVWFNGMDDEELSAFTEAMRLSGDTLDLSPLGITVDKHSTGGVADTVSLIALPVAAACGCRIAKMSGRGLGFTGGTLDKLESIPGFRTRLSEKEFFATVEKYGFSIIELAPADKKFYALRDVTATVDSIPLIASSIMSKKLACGADALVLDVKTGSGAFMKTTREAFKLAQLLTRIGRLAGKRVTALVTDMNQPPGKAVGNAIEVTEAFEILGGKTQPHSRLERLSLRIASEMILLSGKAASLQEAETVAEAALRDGRALKTFAAVIEAQGGDSEAAVDPNRLPQAAFRLTVHARESGFITAVDTEEIGRTAMALGAGRLRKEDKIDAAAGLRFYPEIGSRIEKGEPIAELFTSNESILTQAAAQTERAVIVGKEPAAPLPLVYETEEIQ